MDRAILRVEAFSIWGDVPDGSCRPGRAVGLANDLSTDESDQVHQQRARAHQDIKPRMSPGGTAFAAISVVLCSDALGPLRVSRKCAISTEPTCS